MNALNLENGETEALESLVTRLAGAPWRWDILITGALEKGGSAHYRMIVMAIRKCVAIEDPNADRVLGPSIRRLEKSQSKTDQEAARLLAMGAKGAPPAPVVNK